MSMVYVYVYGLCMYMSMVYVYVYVYGLCMCRCVSRMGATYQEELVAVTRLAELFGDGLDGGEAEVEVLSKGLRLVHVMAGVRPRPHAQITARQQGQKGRGGESEGVIG